MIRLWDPSRPGSEPIELAGHAAAVGALSWSPDGELFASVGGDDTLRLHDRRGGALNVLPVVTGGNRPPLAFSPDGRRLAWGGEGGAGVLDLGSGEAHDLVVPARVWSLAFSPDGATLALGSGDATVRLWSLSSGQVTIGRGHDDYVASLAFSPDGRTLVSGGHDHTLRFWDPATLGAPRVVDSGGEGVAEIACSQDGATVYTRDARETGVRLWDLATGQLTRFLGGHHGEVRSFAISPDGGRLATASRDHTARLWDLATGESRELRGHTDEVFWVAFPPGGEAVLTASRDRTLRDFPDDLPTDPDELRRAFAAGARSEPPGRGD
jgi:WD40 repeat protein